MLTAIIGTIASLASISTLPPQLYQTYKTKSADHVSLFMLINFVIASIGWIVYGILTNSMSILITNGFMLLFSVLLIILKIKYNSKQ